MLLGAFFFQFDLRAFTTQSAENIWARDSQSCQGVPLRIIVFLMLFSVRNFQFMHPSAVSAGGFKFICT